MAVCGQCGVELSPEARFCAGCGAAVTREAEPAGERKVATVLFADLVGSTALGGSQDPERTRAMLDRFYDSMAAEIERAGGTVEKFVGDAVMAAFGVPAAHEDDPERALHVALAMQRRLAELFGDRLALRIGVNTGEVVVGRPREGSSFATGDAVNVCARLEQAAAAGEILVGERTAAAARGAFEFLEPQTIQAKGKPDGVVCRKLVRALSLMRPRGVGGLRPVFVGREDELAALRAAHESTASGGAQLLTIVGDAGVGKTRLVRELWQWLSSREPQPLLRAGRCLAYGQGITYWPLGEVLKEHFGILDSDPPETVAARVGRDGLAFTLGLAPPPGMHPLTVRERLQESWVEFAEELTAERPAVVLVEDLHWAEDDLCDLIELLAERVDGRLLLVTTARPEFVERRPSWHGTLLRLDALPAEETRLLVAELLGPECPAPLSDLVVGRAEGNPFFAEELIATLVDRGVVARSNGGWSFGELPPGFALPDTVQAVLAARIDLLPPAEKAALQAAAVIGRIFWTGPLQALLGSAPDFDLLEEREFVRRRAGSSLAGEEEYAIKHALTREVAYERLLAKALYWLRRAAGLAIGRYEIDEGLTLLRRALELEQDASEQARLWYEIGRANALKYDGEGFLAGMEMSVELGGPAADIYTELGYQFVQRAGMWKTQPDPAVACEWIDRALELTDDGSAQRVKALIARAQLADELSAAQEAVELAERIGDVELHAFALATLATLFVFAEGNYESALPLLEKTRTLWPDVRDPDLRAALDQYRGWMLLGAGRIDAALESARRQEETAVGLTPHHRVHAIGTEVLVESLSGAWGDVLALAPRVEERTEANLASPCPMNVSNLLYCAVAAAHSGDGAEAERLEQEAEAIGMEGYGTQFDPPRMLLALARCDLAALDRLVSGQDEKPLIVDYSQSWAPLFDALVVLGDRERVEADAPAWIAQESYVSPFALRALGLLREDERLVGQAAQAFEAMGLAWHAERTREHRISG
ncbi:MAG: AAA family ATPase [Gaiellaceae bacterium]